MEVYEEMLDQEGRSVQKARKELEKAMVRNQIKEIDEGGDRRSSVGDYFDLLERNIDRMSKGVSALEEKIDGVLLPSTPTEIKEGSDYNQDALMLSPIAARLESQANEVDKIIDRLARILDRIDL